ncbi:MAG TPA: glycosyltransferase family 4 protein [Actinomycetota bacterium]|nr:glycosyltransferase family 4 protein [Actinomycetota bacterium]
MRTLNQKRPLAKNLRKERGLVTGQKATRCRPGDVGGLSLISGNRVTRIITRLNVGGPSRHVLLLNRSLDLAGYDSDLVFGSEGLREGTIDPNLIKAKNISALRRPVHPWHDTQAYRAITKHLRERRPCLVHTHMAKAGILGRLAASREGVPAILHTYHGHVLSGYFRSPLSKLFVQVERWAARRTHALVAISPIIRDELLELGIGKPSQWHIIPLGLDLDEYLNMKLEPLEARERFQIPPDGPLVGMIGRLAPIKDHETFFQVAAAIGASVPKARFVVAGDGELREKLERRARTLLGDRVHFTGWVSDLKTMYSALDLVMLTSRNEGTPLSLIEAAASARPTVATNVGGVRDVVREGVTGYLAPAGNVAELSRRAVEVLRRPEQARQMGNAGREWVRRRFSAERLSTDIQELYSEILRGTTFALR